jgi:hypothetical protein
MSSGQEDEALEHALYQQLLGDSDEIMGKCPETRMQLTGVQDLMKLFFKDVKSHLYLIKEMKIHEFIDYFAKKFDFNLDEVQNHVTNNLEGMGLTLSDKEMYEQNELMIIYMTLTKLVETIRDASFVRYGYDALKEKFEEVCKTEFKQKHKDHLHHMQAMGEKNASLLFNLSFLKLISSTYKYKNMETTIKRLTTMKLNNISNEINSQCDA